MTALPEIPQVAVPAGRLADLAAREPARVDRILSRARRRYTPAGLALADRLSRRWCEARALPERSELAAVARHIGRPGAYALNLSYEWGCSTRLHAPAGQPPLLFRTLDWELGGLGDATVIVTTRGPAGPWIAPTWPGFVGLVHVLAPGRFAAALNQAPGPWTGAGLLADWLAARRRAVRSTGVPPVVLLRRVADQARDFAEAVDLLARTPLTLPTIFAIAGCQPGQATILERAAGSVERHDGSGAITNHWIGDGLPGHSRSPDTRARLAAIQAADPAAASAFDWVRPPVLNPRTRLALAAHAKAGHLSVIAYEAGRPVTAPTSVAAAETARGLAAGP